MNPIHFPTDARTIRPATDVTVEPRIDGARETGSKPAASPEFSTVIELRTTDDTERVARLRELAWTEGLNRARLAGPVVSESEGAGPNTTNRPATSSDSATPTLGPAARPYSRHFIFHDPETGQVLWMEDGHVISGGFGQPKAKPKG